jgi:hypothetical protein
LKGAQLPFRAAVARGFLLAVNDMEHPLLALACAEKFADRLDGKPAQHKEVREHRTTVVYRRGDPPLPKGELPPAAEPESRRAAQPGAQPELVLMEGPP